MRDLVAALRASGERQLREVGVMVRPHPQNAAVWRHHDLSDLGAVTVFPQGGANPVDRKRQDQYFDSLYHSCAVVGINTSAMIEAGIIGRPVVTVRDPVSPVPRKGPCISTISSVMVSSTSLTVLTRPRLCSPRPSRARCSMRPKRAISEDFHPPPGARCRRDTALCRSLGVAGCGSPGTGWAATPGSRPSRDARVANVPRPAEYASQG